VNEEKKNNYEFLDGLGDVADGIMGVVTSIDISPVAEAIGSMFEAL